MSEVSWREGVEAAPGREMTLRELVGDGCGKTLDKLYASLKNLNEASEQVFGQSAWAEYGDDRAGSVVTTDKLLALFNDVSSYIDIVNGFVARM